MEPKKKLDISPDGPSAQFPVKFPPWLHIFVFLLVLSLAGTWYWFGAEALKGTLGILAVVIATYSAYYARRSILSARDRELAARERDRCFETVKFSRIFSDDPLAEARTELATRFRQILNQQQIKGATDASRHDSAVKSLSNEMLAAMEKRDSDGKGPDDLVDEAIAVLDYFEDLAVGIEDGVFDDSTARKLLRGAVISFWRLHQDVARRYRQVNNQPTAYAKTEKLYESWVI
ncbi:DUF4760 domain-containing protein [Anatilimnocola sp. NA78]|uniref:DUF4760 domain-containing protein n=1 Tax=Anatilimnocola sp. NA78 TaxID=3415683 RepID=UPI003CE48F17